MFSTLWTFRLDIEEQFLHLSSSSSSPWVLKEKDQIAFYFMDTRAGYRREVIASVQFPIFALGLEGEGSVAFYFMNIRAGYRREVIASVQFPIFALGLEGEGPVAVYFMDTRAGYTREVLASVQFPIFTLGLEGEGSVAFYFMDTRAGYRREVIASVQFSILAPTDSWIRWLHLFSKMERWKAHASHALLGLTMASAKKRITLFHLSSKMERWAQAFHVLLGLTMASAKKRTMLFRLFSKRKRTNFSYPVHRSTDDRDWLSMSSSRAENPHLDQAASWPSVHVLTA